MRATTALLVVLSGVLARLVAGQFVVETNSMRIREPDALAGEFDVAIGDVCSSPTIQDTVKPDQRTL